jgi:hypothetical protein
MHVAGTLLAAPRIAIGNQRVVPRRIVGGLFLPEHYAVFYVQVKVAGLLVGTVGEMRGFDYPVPIPVRRLDITE